MVREVKVARRYRQCARTDVIDGMARCAYLREADLALPRAAPVDLIAERDLPLAPDAQGISWEVLGQPGPAADVDAQVAVLQYQVHAGPPLRLENPADGERRAAVGSRPGTAQPHQQVGVVLPDGEVSVPVVAGQHHDCGLLPQRLRVGLELDLDHAGCAHILQPGRRPRRARIVHLAEPQGPIRAPGYLVADRARRAPGEREVRDDNEHQDHSQEGHTEHRRGDRRAPVDPPPAHASGSHRPLTRPDPTARGSRVLSASAGLVERVLVAMLTPHGRAVVL